MKAAFLKNRPSLRIFLLIFLGFFLTSSVYLSCHYHLMNFVDSGVADAVTMIACYILQAAGIGLGIFLFRKKGFRITTSGFMAVLILYAISMVPALLSKSLAGTLVFGLITNLLCGIIAAYYLQELTFSADSGGRGLIFGCGYSAATVATWLISLTESGNALKSKWILIVYLASALILGIIVRVSDDKEKKDDLNITPPGGDRDLRKLLILAAACVFLMSLVKNLGFSFPSSDLRSGVSLELSRIFYAAGLVIAGAVSDKNRRYGASCAFASMIIPFVMLALSGEPISGMIFWCLDYFIFAFIAVYRVILFSDLAKARNMIFLAGCGLLFGRLGDAAGSFIYRILPDSTTVLVITAAAFFILVVVCFFRLYQKLYATSFSEQDHFDRFVRSHDLSMRERTILRMLLNEQTNTQIAESLFLSESTVKFHIHNLLQKTACRNRKELLNKYAEMKNQ